MGALNILDRCNGLVSYRLTISTSCRCVTRRKRVSVFNFFLELQVCDAKKTSTCFIISREDKEEKLVTCDWFDFANPREGVFGLV